MLFSFRNSAVSVARIALSLSVGICSLRTGQASARGEAHGLLTKASSTSVAI